MRWGYPKRGEQASCSKRPEQASLSTRQLSLEFTGQSVDTAHEAPGPATLSRFGFPNTHHVHSASSHCFRPGQATRIRLRGQGSCQLPAGRGAAQGTPPLQLGSFESVRRKVQVHHSSGQTDS